MQFEASFWADCIKLGVENGRLGIRLSQCFWVSPRGVELRYLEICKTDRGRFFSLFVVLRSLGMCLVNDDFETRKGDVQEEVKGKGNGRSISVPLTYFSFVNPFSAIAPSSHLPTSTQPLFQERSVGLVI